MNKFSKILLWILATPGIIILGFFAILFVIFNFKLVIAALLIGLGYRIFYNEVTKRKEKNNSNGNITIQR